MTSTSRTFINRAQALADRVDGEGRGMTPDERVQFKDLLDSAENANNIAKIGRLFSDGGPEGSSDSGLYGAMASAGYNRIEHPSVVVPFRTFGAAATFDGTYADAVPSFVTAPPLGADSRFLFPQLVQQPVDPDATSISSFRQKSRTLPTLSSMIRNIDAVTPKPEVATVTEVVTPPLHQIAAVETDVPNIMLESNAFAGWINGDLRFAYASAVDFHVVTQIAATTPTQAAAGADLLEAIVNAAELVASAGYAPRIIAADPATLIELLLLKQPGTTDYVGAQMDRVLSGLQRVAVAGLSGVCYVLDPAALGTLFASPVRLQSFEQDAGQTNSSTVRIESNGLYLVQRADAVAEVPVAS